MAAGQHFLTDTLKTNCEYLGFNKNPLLTNKSGIMTGTGKEILKQGLYDLVMCPQGDMVRYYNIEKRKQSVVITIWKREKALLLLKLIKI